MSTKSMMTKSYALYSIFLLLPPALCHMEMSWPYPLHSKYNPANNYEDIDYSMTSPLEADGSNFPCKGYQNDRPVVPTINYTAGSTYNMSLAGSATHGGGSCQLSLSYDNGATFRVIKSMIGGCPLVSTYDFTIPSYAPGGQALLAWTWQNYEGNREFYMNCAEVNIESSGTTRRRGRRQTYNSFESLPYIWIANLASINDCNTTDSENPVYPSPGPDVLYGDGMSSSDPPSDGDCDIPTSYGQTYKVLSVNDTGVAVVPSGSSTVEENTATQVQSSATNSSVSSYSEPMQSTVTITLDCPDSATITTTSGGTVMTVTALSQSTSSTLATATSTPAVTTTASPSQSPTVVTNTATVSSVPAASSSASSGTPAYATGDGSAYLPCVPGTFLCTSDSAWLTCDYNSAGTAYIYDDSRTVAAGMECLPALSPYTNQSQQYAQQANTSAGYYRDDRYVRAQPDGSCSVDGSIQCTNSGTTFDMCDQGGWVEMGSVAAGTTCENGQIVAS